MRGSRPRSRGELGVQRAVFVEACRATLGPAARVRADHVTRACLVLAAILLVYRADAQSITWDEAYTYQVFLRGSLLDALRQFNANNHVLFSVFGWVSVQVFGASEFSLRLPTVLAAVLFMVSTYRIHRWLLGGSWWLPVCTVAVVLHPLMLDFLIAARGYGLALACLATAIERSLPLLDGESSRRGRWLTVSALLGLCMCSHLAYAVPAAALAVVLLGNVLLTPREQRPGFVRMIVWLSWPATVTVSLCLGLSLQDIRTAQLWYGADHLTDTVRSLAEPLLPDGWRGGWRSTGMLVLALASLATLVTAALRLLGASLRHDGVPAAAERRSTMLLSMVGALGVSALLLAAMRVAVGFRYPLDRTGLYVIVFASFAGSAFITLDRAPWYLRQFMRCALLVIAILSLVQLRTTHFELWRFDAGARDIFDAMLARARDPDAPLRVASTPWLFAPSLNFYRTIRRFGGMQPVRDDWDGRDLNYDYFVLDPGDRALADVKPHATLVLEHPVSGVLLFARPRR